MKEISQVRRQVSDRVDGQVYEQVSWQVYRQVYGPLQENLTP